MDLQTRSFSLFVRDMASAMQARSQKPLDLSIGSVLRALLEAVATVALWVQWQALQVLQTTRAATSQGADLDTWMADFGLTRLSPTAATGYVTMGRYTAGIPAVIPVGTTVKSADGTMTFSVVADASNGAWAGTGYAVAAGALTVDVPIVATLPGPTGNVAPGTISVLASPLVGIDTVTNSSGLSGGSPGESDDAFRARFAAYINSRSLATQAALVYAALSVGPNLRVNVLDCSDVNGLTKAGSFTVVIAGAVSEVDAGTLANVQTAIEATRPVGVTYAVKQASPVVVNIVFHPTLAPGADVATVLATVRASIDDVVAALPIGAELAVSRVIATIHQACPSVFSVNSLTLNGGGDLQARFDEVLVLGLVSAI